MLYQVLADALESFLERVDTDPIRGRLPGFVVRELRAFLRCGILQYGFARVFCPQCRMDALVALSCKGRGFCPSCGARRMADTAAWLVDRVLPDVPVRQWVVTLPHRIRFLCACDPELCAGVRRIAVRAIGGFLARRAKAHGIADPRAGAIVFCQRFDQALRLNLHFHMLCPDGVFERPPFAARADFHPDDPLTDRDLEQLVAAIRARVLRLLRKRGRFAGNEDAPTDADIDPSPLTTLAAAAVQGRLALGPEAGAPAPRLGRRRDRVAARTKKKLCAECDGFTLHANVCIPAGDAERLEKLCRYAARPPIVDDKLALSADGTHVVYRFRRPFRDGSTHVVLTCQEFIARLAALIPRPRAHLVTYHGVFAPAAAWRDRIVPDPPEDHFDTTPPERCSHGSTTTTPPTPRLRERRPYSWAELMQRVYRIDVLVCEHCGGLRRLLAAILESHAIRTVLGHLGLATEPPKVAPARPPPGRDDLLFA